MTSNDNECLGRFVFSLFVYKHGCTHITTGRICHAVETLQAKNGNSSRFMVREVLQVHEAGRPIPPDHTAWPVSSLWNTSYLTTLKQPAELLVVHGDSRVEEDSGGGMRAI